MLFMFTNINSSMFTSISSAYKIITNFAAIRDAISTIYTVVIKTANVVAYLETQINDTKLGTIVAQYLPLIKSVLTKIQSIIEKYGALIGITVTAPVAAKSDEDHEKALKDALNDLDELLKK